MVERFCWLVEKGVPAESVLAVTFTERAAAELRERISRELAERGRRAQSALIDEAWIGTFHGVCTRLLRDNAGQPAATVAKALESAVTDYAGGRVLDDIAILVLRAL